MFEERIAALEGAEDAFATASGMAAVSGALMSMLKAGDRVVSSRALFGSCLYVLEDILTRYGVEVVFVDGTDMAQWAAAITPETDVVFFESVSNPTLEVIDLSGVAASWPMLLGALVHGRQRLCHACFLQRSLRLGRRCGDLFGHQAYRRAGAGAWAAWFWAAPTFIRKTLEPYLKHTGACHERPSPPGSDAKGAGNAWTCGCGRRRASALNIWPRRLDGSRGPGARDLPRSARSSAAWRWRMGQMHGSGGTVLAHRCCTAVKAVGL